VSHCWSQRGRASPTPSRPVRCATSSR
jgi:hypothetical protein